MENIKIKGSTEYSGNIVGFAFIVLGASMLPKAISSNEMLSELAPTLLFIIAGLALLTHFTQIAYDKNIEKVIVTRFIFLIKKQRFYSKSSFKNIRVYLNLDFDDRNMNRGPKYVIEINGKQIIKLGKTPSKEKAIAHGRHIAELMNLPLNVLN